MDNRPQMLIWKLYIYIAGISKWYSYLIDVTFDFISKLKMFQISSGITFSVCYVSKRTGTIRIYKSHNVDVSNTYSLCFVVVMSSVSSSYMTSIYLCLRRFSLSPGQSGLDISKETRNNMGKIHRRVTTTQHNKAWNVSLSTLGFQWLYHPRMSKS